ncbi:MAG: hypothetical protein EOO61_19325, partial [Hymenobacter sp.]
MTKLCYTWINFSLPFRLPFYQPLGSLSRFGHCWFRCDFIRFFFALLMKAVDNPLDVFFDLVPTGAALYAPVFDESSELVDFRFVRLNPAGQRLLGLPAQPPHSFREYYPHSVPTGIFTCYCAAYLTGQASTYDVLYAGDGIDTFFRLVVQRSGELLVVS